MQIMLRSCALFIHGVGSATELLCANNTEGPACVIAIVLVTDNTNVTK